MPKSVKDVLQDEKFHGLPLEEQRKVLTHLDPNFKSLAAPEQTKFLQSRSGSKKPPLPPQPGTAGPSKLEEFAGNPVSSALMSPEAYEKTLHVASKVAVEPFEKLAGASGGFAKALAHKTIGSELYSNKMYKQEAEHPESGTTKALQVERGVLSGGAEAVGSMIGDMRNWPFFIGGPAGIALKRMLAGGFSALMIKGAYDEMKAIKDDPSMQLEQKVEHITKMSINLGGAVVGGKEAFKGKASGVGEPPKPPEQSRVETAAPKGEAETKAASASTRGPSEKSPYSVKPDAEREKSPLNVSKPGISPNHTLELEHNGKSVGFALVRGIPEVKPKAVEMSVSEVFEDDRGQHHGTELYKQAADHAKSQGADYLMSDTKRTADAERMWTSLKEKYPDRVSKVGNRWQWDLRNKPLAVALPASKSSKFNLLTNKLAGISPGQKLNVQAKGIIREYGAKRVRTLEQAYSEIGEDESRLNKKPETAVPSATAIQADLKKQNIEVDEQQAHTLDVIDRIEKGKQQANPKDQAVATFLRKITDSARDTIRGLGTGKLEHFYENYFGHLWEDPRHADEVLGGWSPGKPLTGRGSFLKTRTIPTVLEGVKLGLKPVSWNPVTLSLLKYAEMQRYIAGQKIFAEFKDKGIAVHFPEGEKGPLSSGRPPKGWIPINDKVARNHWGPPEAIGVLNRHLSASLKMRYPDIAKFADVIRSLNNDMNVAQVSLSGFHPFMETMNSLGSEMQRAGRMALKGEFGKAVKSAALSATVFGPVIKDSLVGRRLAKEWLKPGSQATPYSQFVNEMEHAGARATADRVYFNQQKGWWQDVNRAISLGHPIEAALKAPAAFYKTLSGIMQKIGTPIMGKMVPWSRNGVFAKLYEFELDKLGPEASEDDHRIAMGRLWDTIENYMGLMTQDNLFWDNTAKDFAFMGAHFFSWFHGTNRAAFGGVKDIVRQPLRYAKGEKVELTPNAAWLMSIPLAYMYVGAITNYLLSKERPKELKDYFHPRTGRKLPDGNPERINYPSYVPTVEKMVGHPVKYVEDEYSNGVRMFFQFINNEDNMKKQVYNPDDPASKKAFQVMKYIASQYSPISASTLKQSKDRGESTLAAFAEAASGFRPASAEITRQPWQNKLVEYARRHIPAGPVSPEDFEHRQEILQMKNKVLTGDMSFDELRAKVNEHSLTPKELQYILRATHQDSYLEMFKRLPYNEQQIVFDMVGDQKEKDRLKPFLQRKKGKYEHEHPEKSQVTRPINSPFGMPPSPPTSA